MELSNYINKGYTGLNNLGNTCFLNSSIQVLSNTHELNKILDEKIKNNKVKNIIDSELLKEYNELRVLMWKTNGVISPKKFLLNVHKIAETKERDIFTGYDQNDMPEFLLFLIDTMHNSLARSTDVSITGKVETDIDNIAVKCYELIKNTYKREYSEIMDLFYGIYITEIISKNGKKIHNAIPEQFMMLDLPIPDNKETSIYDCLDDYVNYETLEGDNSWYNDKTKKKEDVKKRMIFWSFPKILIIVLKRFSDDGRHKKLNNVKYPLNNLNLSKYVKGYNASKYVYDLYGVCNHVGNLNTGHYTTFIKTLKNDWIHFNDDNISKIRESNIITPMSYCLFYRKKNNL